MLDPNSMVMAGANMVLGREPQGEHHRNERSGCRRFAGRDIGRWRSSTVEHLICNQAVVGSIPIASLENRSAESSWLAAERYPSGQREQTVNLPASAYGGSNPPLSI